jgi:hypothetical protein
VLPVRGKSETIKRGVPADCAEVRAEPRGVKSGGVVARVIGGKMVEAGEQRRVVARLNGFSYLYRLGDPREVRRVGGLFVRTVYG